VLSFAELDSALERETNMAQSTCPWWLGYLLASPIRKLFQNPTTILGPHVKAGMTILEPGPGMGFFTLELARLVGASGRVVAVDLQPEMLASLRKRAAKAGLQERIETREAQPNSLGVEDLAAKVDFALAFALVHELPDAAAFFRQVAHTLKSDGTVLFAEPPGHVSKEAFRASVDAAKTAGLREVGTSQVSRSHAVILGRA